VLAGLQDDVSDLGWAAVVMHVIQVKAAAM
jgi:hypothetical protein